MSLGELAFRVGRRVGKHPVAGKLFCLTERLLPVKRIAREDGLVAFQHPRPIANPHVLIVPTRPLPALTSGKLSDSEKSQVIWRMVLLAQRISLQLPSAQSWQLVINGGSRQDIGQMHGHLLSASEENANGGAMLVDPAVEIGVWQELMTELRQAERAPDSGFSLEVRWNAHDHPVAKVTESVTRH